jgi:hypothetical protein
MRRVLLCVVLLAVAGCGSSSSGSGSTQASATTGPGGTNRQAIADCLKKQGIDVPQRPSGAPPQGGGPGAGGPSAGGGFLFGGGPQGGGNGSGGRDFSKIRAALQKCGINPQQGQRRFNPQNSAQFRQALTKFVSCVRKNGYDLPDPNMSGNGPVFDSSKVDRNDPKFKSATGKCAGKLQALRPQGGGPPPGSAG